MSNVAWSGFWNGVVSGFGADAAVVLGAVPKEGKVRPKYVVADPVRPQMPCLYRVIWRQGGAERHMPFATREAAEHWRDRNQPEAKIAPYVSEASTVRLLPRRFGDLR